MLYWRDSLIDLLSSCSPVTFHHSLFPASPRPVVHHACSRVGHAWAIVSTKPKATTLEMYEDRLAFDPLKSACGLISDRTHLQSTLQRSGELAARTPTFLVAIPSTLSPSPPLCHHPHHFSCGSAKLKKDGRSLYSSRRERTHKLIWKLISFYDGGTDRLIVTDLDYSNITGSPSTTW